MYLWRARCQASLDQRLGKPRVVISEQVFKPSPLFCFRYGKQTHEPVS